MRDRVALTQYIDQRINAAHSFGWNDCVSFVLGAVAAQFGRAPQVGANWSDERTAKRAIARLGGIEAAADRMFRSILPSEAVAGDIAGVEDPAIGFHVMLVEGQTLVAPGETGLVRLPRSSMLRAWSSDPTEAKP